ncbi:hypothetical protein GCM10022222_07170 [Amycolatopsis ultiminotia]|uniref:Uncharacterized protein n=1 Tax=Amycolatopsis ultiminotia TaxID=543629 RepID=A0ABP6V1I1_9PSEU
MGKLDDKVAIVTGGSRGIGAASALADEGADVAISYSSSAERAKAVVADLEAKGVHAAAFQADQADATQAAGLVRRVAEQFGKLDILVNNAALGDRGLVGSELTGQAAVDRQLAVNYTSVVAGIQAAVPLLPDGGRIVSISSGVAARAGSQGARARNRLSRASAGAPPAIWRTGTARSTSSSPGSSTPKETPPTAQPHPCSSRQRRWAATAGRRRSPQAWSSSPARWLPTSPAQY